jgi:hypothetical protein
MNLVVSIYDPLRWIYVTLFIKSMLLLKYRKYQIAGVLEFVNNSVVYGDTRILVISSCTYLKSTVWDNFTFTRRRNMSNTHTYSKNRVEFK